MIAAAGLAVAVGAWVIAGRDGGAKKSGGGAGAPAAADPWAGGTAGGADRSPTWKLPNALGSAALKARPAGPPVVVTGVVRLAPGGTPVAGAEVAFMNDSGENTAIADDSGRYSITVASGVWWKVHARTDTAVGYPETITPTRDAAVRDLEIHPTATVRGKVVDMRGALVPGAVVSLEVDPGVKGLLESALPMADTADDGGRFTLAAPAGPLKVKGAKGLHMGVAVVPTLAPGETAELEVKLLDPIRVTGRVVDADGKPVAGAKILAAATIGQGGPTEKTQFESGADGGFAFQQPASWLRLEARHRDGISAAIAQYIGSGASLENVVLTVAEPDGLHGKVMTSDGTPVAGARVRLVAHAVYDTTTGNDGSFVAGAVAGQPYLVKVKHSDGGVERQVAAWNGEETFVLRRFGGLRVVAQGDGGDALGEIEVTIDSFLPAGEKVARTPATARFRGAVPLDVANLEPGLYDLTVAAKGAGAIRVARVAVAEGESRTVPVELVPPAIVRGTVKTGQQPVAHAQVIVAGRHAFTDARGRFTVDGVPSGRVSIAVQKAGFGQAWASAVAGKDAGPVEIELRPSGDGAGLVDGIGVILAPTPVGAIVASVLPGSPADGKLSAGDRIASVDGDDVGAFALDEIVARLRGSAGSSVSITVMRGDDESTVDVVRKRLVVPEGTQAVAIAARSHAGGRRC